MRLRPDSRKRLAGILKDALNSHTLAQLISLGLGEEPDNVITDGTVPVQVGEVIAWAEDQERVPDLLAAARDQLPNREDLQEIELHYLSRPVEVGASWVGRHPKLSTIGAIAGITSLLLAIWLGFFRPENEDPRIDFRPTEVAIAGEAAVFDLLSNVTDDGPFEDLTAQIVRTDTDAGGTVASIGPGRAEYTARAGSSGIDGFAYIVMDGDGGSAEGQVTVKVIAGAMEPGLNIAVAELDPRSDSAQAIAFPASTAIEERIRLALGESGLPESQYHVLGPRLLGPLSEDRPPLAELAERLNADILIFGTADSGGASSQLEVQFFLDASQLAGAEELAGEYSFDPVDLAAVNDLAIPVEIERELGPSLVALVEFSRGLSFYQTNEYATAEGHLRTASDDWPVTSESSNGKEAVLQLLGNVLGEREMFEDARDVFSDILNMPGASTARAEFGLAETEFLLNAGSICGQEGDTDVAVLEASLATFERLSAAPDPEATPERRILAARAQVEIGKVALCLARKADVDASGDLRERLETAFVALTTVIRDEEDNDQLRDLIGEAHQLLGFYYRLLGDPARAVGEYLAAIASTQEEAREAKFNHTLAGVYKCELLDEENADKHYRESNRLHQVLGSDPEPEREC